MPVGAGSRKRRKPLATQAGSAGDGLEGVVSGITFSSPDDIRNGGEGEQPAAASFQQQQQQPLEKQEQQQQHEQEITPAGATVGGATAGGAAGASAAAACDAQAAVPGADAMVREQLCTLAASPLREHRVLAAQAVCAGMFNVLVDGPTRDAPALLQRLPWCTLGRAVAMQCPALLPQLPQLVLAAMQTQAAAAAAAFAAQPSPGDEIALLLPPSRAVSPQELWGISDGAQLPFAAGAMQPQQLQLQQLQLQQWQAAGRDGTAPTPQQVAAYCARMQQQVHMPPQAVVTAALLQCQQQQQQQWLHQEQQHAPLSGSQDHQQQQQMIPSSSWLFLPGMPFSSLPS